jgi:hypothetical protein
MSEHTLPPDRSSWPKDPYRLLGVGPEASARDLRRAYLHLVRTYKPEHAPEEFRLIRAAYETLKERAELLASWKTGEGEPADPAIAPPADRPSSPFADGSKTGSGTDPWERAVLGEIEPAYRELAGLAGTGTAREEVYLQLYWLLTLDPRLERGKHPCDWLVRGLLDRGSDARRLASLVSREAAFDPAAAAGEPFAPLRSSRVPPAHLVEIFSARWKAARALARWEVVREDLGALRTWVPDADGDFWARLLIAAASNLVWAPGTESAALAQLKDEAQACAHRGLDLDGDLTLIEYAERAARGLLALWPQYAYTSRLHDLLRLTWNQPWPAARAHLRTHLADVAADPHGWLRRFTLVRAQASPSLQMLMDLPDHLGMDGAVADEDEDEDEEADQRETAAAIVEFLASERWWVYPSLRPNLLAFCIAEMISPARVVSVTRDYSQLRLRDDQHLADTVEADLPLAYVYRGYTSVRA